MGLDMVNRGFNEGPLEGPHQVWEVEGRRCSNLMALIKLPIHLSGLRAQSKLTSQVVYHHVYTREQPYDCEVGYEDREADQHNQAEVPTCTN